MGFDGMPDFDYSGNDSDSGYGRAPLSPPRRKDQVRINLYKKHYVAHSEAKFPKYISGNLSEMGKQVLFHFFMWNDFIDAINSDDPIKNTSVFFKEPEIIKEKIYNKITRLIDNKDIQAELKFFRYLSAIVTAYSECFYYWFPDDTEEEKRETKFLEDRSAMKRCILYIKKFYSENRSNQLKELKELGINESDALVVTEACVATAILIFCLKNGSDMVAEQNIFSAYDWPSLLYTDKFVSCLYSLLASFGPVNAFAQKDEKESATYFNYAYNISNSVVAFNPQVSETVDSVALNSLRLAWFVFKNRLPLNGPYDHEAKEIDRLLLCVLLDACTKQITFETTRRDYDQLRAVMPCIQPAEGEPLEWCGVDPFDSNWERHVDASFKDKPIAFLMKHLSRVVDNPYIFKSQDERLKRDIQEMLFSTSGMSELSFRGDLFIERFFSFHKESIEFRWETGPFGPKKYAGIRFTNRLDGIFNYREVHETVAKNKKGECVTTIMDQDFVDKEEREYGKKIKAYHERTCTIS